MFQYAVLRAIQLRTGFTSKVDIALFEKYGLHQGFEIKKIFSQAPISIASSADVNGILGWRSRFGLSKIFIRPDLDLLRPSNFIVEPNLQFQKQVLNIGDDSYLCGYWQSEKYFFDVRDQIRKDLIFSQLIDDVNKEYEKQIASTNSISLHIRRGDYVANPASLAIHGVCSIDYYKLAIAHIEKNISSPIYFIFSDDMPWARSNFGFLNSAVFIDHNKNDKSYIDMQLMSYCKHHIIANSSFSWWGAWLNNNPGKIVISPKRWFADTSKLSQDLIPDSWIKL